MNRLVQARMRNPTRLSHPMQRLALWGPAQLGAGLLVACVVPMMFRGDFWFLRGFSSVSQYNSLVATACAVLLGYLISRRLFWYPCNRNLACIIPSFAIGYGIVICIILSWRLEYSRAFIVLSFLNAQVWFHVIVIFAEKFSRPRFDIIPFGAAEKLRGIPHIHWDVPKAPDLTGRHVDGIAVDLRADIPEAWEMFIAESALRGVPVYHFKQLREDLTGMVEIEHLSENNLGSLLPPYFYLHIKQAVDMAFVVLILPVVVPLFALIAIGIKWNSAGPVFFSQPRIGYRGKVFTIWKFRTMQASHSNGIDDREAAMTRDGDLRVTSFGRLLRATRLDELPQVVNILRGEMSWIGPRPEAVALSRWYEKDIPFYRYRHIVPPGITGWAQVNQGHVTLADDVRRKLHYDFYYIKYFSIWLDVLIALRTIAVMLRGIGSR